MCLNALFTYTLWVWSLFLSLSETWMRTKHQYLMGILNKQHFLTTEYYIGIEKNKVHTNIVVEQKCSWYSFEWSELVREPYNPICICWSRRRKIWNYLYQIIEKRRWKWEIKILLFYLMFLKHEKSNLHNLLQAYPPSALEADWDHKLILYSPIWCNVSPILQRDDQLEVSRLSSQMQEEAYWIFLLNLNPRFYPEYKIIYICHERVLTERMGAEKGRGLSVHKDKIHDMLEWNMHSFLIFGNLYYIYIYMM